MASSGPSRLGAFIRDNLDAIVAQWENFARSLDGTHQMSAMALQDHCREILLSVADDMEQDQTDGEQAAKSKGHSDTGTATEDAATSHGVLRLLSGFDLVQLVAEFRALRASVLALWGRSRGPGTESQDLMESIRFNEGIDRALADSVKSYAANLTASRDMFLAILGHDLRGPLSSINMGCAVLGKPELADASRLRAVTNVKRAALEMRQLISDLLEYTRSRLGAGIPIEGADCDLGPLCEEAIESVRASHPEQAFEFQAVGDLQLQADARRLHQVLSNLLNNAVQHGDRRAPVSVHAHGEPGAVVLSVRNAGLPIRADLIPTIFEPLVQSLASSRAHPDERSRTSTGLGLFIVREIVQGHHGSIAVQSTVDTGTVFTIHLPRVLPRGSGDGSPDTELDAPQGAPPAMSKVPLPGASPP